VNVVFRNNNNNMYVDFILKRTYLNTRYNSALQNSFQILPETIWHFPLCFFRIYDCSWYNIIYIYIKVYSHNCVRTVYRSQLNCQHRTYIYCPNLTHKFYYRILRTAAKEIGCFHSGSLQYIYIYIFVPI
jgi:hypothetical protein